MYRYPPRPGIDAYTYGDGLFGLIAKGVGGLLKKVVPKHTIVGKLLGGAKAAAPTVALGAAAGAAGQMLVPGGTGGGVPALPSGMPQLPATTAAAAGYGVGQAITNIIPWWKGPGGALQAPWADPATMKGLKSPFVLDDKYLMIRYRAPKGYVVVRDKNGKPYPMWKPLAQKMRLWYPSAKPPISAGDWNKFQTAKAVEKKLRRIASKGLSRRGFTKKTTTPKVFKESKATVHRRVA